MGEPKSELKAIVPPHADDIKNAESQRIAKQLSRRTLVKRAVGFGSALFAAAAGVKREAIKETASSAPNAIIHSLENKILPTPEYHQPERQASPKLTAEELVNGQKNANFDNLKKFGYEWIESDERPTSDHNPRIVLFDIIPGELAVGQGEGINMWQGIAKDAELTDPLLVKDIDTYIPGRKVAVARIHGEEAYTILGTEETTYSRYGFVTGEQDDVTEEIAYSFSLPTGEPLPEGMLPIVTSANFGTVIS